VNYNTAQKGHLTLKSRGKVCEFTCWQILEIDLY